MLVLKAGSLGPARGRANADQSAGTLRHVFAVFALVVAASAAEPPVFSFGAIADVQYADQETRGPRAYRASLAKLEQCAASLARERLAFTIQLGDLVDGGSANLDRILPLWERVPAPRYHVLGNHDQVAPRDALLKRMGLSSPYYDFTVRGWRFVVLDGMNVGADDPRGAALLGALKARAAPNAQAWNGALGPAQREWLAGALADAARRKQRAVVFCHFPVLAESCRPEHLLWDHAQVLAILESHPAVAAYISGHDHRGGYALRNQVHYITLPGMVEHDVSAACQVIDVHRDRLVLRGAGRRNRRPFPLPPSPL
jgi:3',5'-cyclic AMP phosphodiesterase CpdA